MLIDESNRMDEAFPTVSISEHFAHDAACYFDKGRFIGIITVCIFKGISVTISGLCLPFFCVFHRLVVIV